MTSAALPSPPHVPRIGRYELLGVIGTGGMGRIYLARVCGEGGFEREVALKVLHPHLLAEDEFVAMFLDEARLAARIRHPNVVSTLDVQKTPEALFLVMDLVEGLSLADLVKRRRTRLSSYEAPPSSDTDISAIDGRAASSRRGTSSSKRYEPLPVLVACRIAVDMLKGLHAAHELTDREGQPLNLVHRDMSPGNLLIGHDGISRITDFGVARAETRLTATMGGKIKGKVPYMPPEQLVANSVDRRTDVYAAGVVLWEMLAGRRLFRNKNQGALMQEILKGAQVPPGQLRPGVPRSLDHICMRALAIDPDRRFATAAEFASEINKAIRMTGRQSASSEDVAAFVSEYGTTLEHMDAARRSAPSVSGVDLVSPASDSSPSFTPISLPQLPQVTSSASQAIPPPPLPVSEVTRPAAEAASSVVTDGRSSSVSESSGILGEADVVTAPGKSSRTLLVALVAALVGGGIAVAAYSSGRAQASGPNPSASAVRASTTHAERGAAAAPPALTTPPPTPIPSTGPTIGGDTSTAEPSAPAPSVSPLKRPPSPRSISKPQPTIDTRAPALSEQLPTEL